MILSESTRIILIAIHVDDLVYASEAEFEENMDRIKEEILFGREGINQVRFCGTELIQYEDFSRKVIMVNRAVSSLSPLKLMQTGSNSHLLSAQQMRQETCGAPQAQSCELRIPRDQVFIIVLAHCSQFAAMRPSQI